MRVDESWACNSSTCIEEGSIGCVKEMCSVGDKGRRNVILRFVDLWERVNELRICSVYMTPCIQVNRSN